ncbi:MAG: DUF5011 domain-containing protein [Bacilli bacterium]|nr:DUF5011 domain-containing protein [Bacilli bacterium]
MRVKIKAMIAVFVIFLVVAIYGIHYYFFMPTITLKGDKNMMLNYNEDYKESGYYAMFHNQDVTQKVQVKGEVDSKKLGIYKMEYFIKQGVFKRKAVRIVKVRDLTNPVLILKNDHDKVYICPNTEYNFMKYKAYDNYDQDITDRVKITRKNDIIQYAVVDSSGNYAIKNQKIIQQDLEKPSLELNSGDMIFTFLNEEFKDPGYQVFDNCDQNIEKKVQVEGKVNTKKAGIYELTYKVKDASGNSSQKKRKVQVVKRGQNGSVYLTFDDGPRMGTTNVILDILKEENVPATFFVTNNGPDELIKREYQEGHTVGLHTASHDYSLVYSSKENYFNDLYSVHDRVLRITGYDSKVIRFPGGSSNTISKKYRPGIMSDLTKEVLKRDFRYYDWNINSRDTDGLTTSNEIVSWVNSSLSHDKVNIILMHDIKPYTRDALKGIIEYGKQNGYRFEAITKDTEMFMQKVNN